jgi:hypothetical protein
MQSTINRSIQLACLSLDVPSLFADKLIAHLWRSIPKEVLVLPNLEKLNRQQVQRLESMIVGDVDKPSLHKSFTQYVNQLTPDVFKSTSLTDHMEEFIRTTMPDEDEDEDLVEINFHLRTFDVGLKTHRVYELREGVHVFVGMLGMNGFQDMVLPELE